MIYKINQMERETTKGFCPARSVADVDRPHVGKDGGSSGAYNDTV
jgi:hypothetical protein